MAWLTFTYIDERIIGYRNSQIFEISASPSQINIIELDNDGLLGKGITSISKLQNKVYITTYAGVYYKDINDFFVEQRSNE